MKIAIDENYSNVRIDKFLRNKLRNLPLQSVYKLIRIGKIKVNDKKVKPDYRLRLGDNLDIFLSDSEIENLTKKELFKANKISFNVLYEDDNLLIVNKPAFLASHSGTGVMENNLMDQIKLYLKDKKSEPALINRLDRLTSGIIIIGKNLRTTRALNKMIKDDDIEKRYIALVNGIIKDNNGVIRTKLKRVHERFQHKAIISDEGKLAETHYRVLRKFKEYTLIELILKTGRMHQIRAQLQHINHPIIGDTLYGNEEINKIFNKKFKLKRQFLHAFKILFKHPITNKQLEITSDLPEDLNKMVTILKQNE